MVEASFLFLLTVIGYLSWRNYELKDENDRLREFEIDTYHDYPSSPICAHGRNVSGKFTQKKVTFNAADKQIEIIADVEVDDNLRLFITNCAIDFHSKFDFGDRFETVTLQLESDCSITFISGFRQSIVSDRLCIQCDRYVLNCKTLKGKVYAEN